MARYAKNDPRCGGFVKIWAKAYLQSKTISKLTLEEQGALTRLLVSAQVIQWTTGAFKVSDIALSDEQICIKAGIKPTHLQRLFEVGLLSKDQENATKIKAWEEHQLKSDLIPIKLELNSNNNSNLTPLKTLKDEGCSLTSVSSHHSDFINQPSTENSKQIPKGGLNQTPKTERQKIAEQLEDLERFLQKPNLSDDQIEFTKTKYNKLLKTLDKLMESELNSLPNFNSK